MPRNKYPEQTVEKILDAAAALFAEKGYQSTTLQDIIDATGLSKGAVYHHFRSKEEIARKVGDRMGDEMWEPLRRIREAAGLTGLQKLQAVFAMSFAGDRQQRMGRTLPHLTDDPYFLYWSGRASRNVWCRSALRPLSGRAWPMAASIPETPMHWPVRCSFWPICGCRPRAALRLARSSEHATGSFSR